MLMSGSKVRGATPVSTVVTVLSPRKWPPFFYRALTSYVHRHQGQNSPPDSMLVLDDSENRPVLKKSLYWMAFLCRHPGEMCCSEKCLLF